MENILKDELLAFVPQYIENLGNCTVIYTKNNKPITLEKNIRTVIRLICKHYMIDFRETKRRYTNLMSSPNMIPLPLSKSDIFIPLKTRKPLCKNDGAMGYINMKHINKLTEIDGSTIIKLTTGIEIKCLYNKTTVNNHLRDGSIVSNCYKERHMMVAENEAIYDGKKPIIIIYEK